MASQVTPGLEAMTNQAIPSIVAALLAASTPPQQLSPQAVISANRVVITSSGLTLILSAANIFGPVIIPLPPPRETTVPDVLGMTVPDAAAAIRAADLRMRELYDLPRDRTFTPIIEDQGRDGGTTVKVGTEVTVTVKLHPGAGP
jgi:PASTA domain